MRIQKSSKESIDDTPTTKYVPVVNTVSRTRQNFTLDLLRSELSVIAFCWCGKSHTFYLCFNRTSMGAHLTKEQKDESINICTSAMIWVVVWCHEPNISLSTLNLKWKSKISADKIGKIKVLIVLLLFKNIIDEGGTCSFKYVLVCLELEQYPYLNSIHKKSQWSTTKNQQQKHSHILL